MLTEAGYSVRLVDAWSQDSEPATLAQYVRRSNRWAQQTVEVFRLPWRSIPGRYQVALTFALYFYLRPLAFLLLLLLSIWTATGRTWSLNNPLTIYLPFTDWPVSVMLFVFLAGVWLCQLLLHIILVYRARVRLRDYVHNTLLSFSLAHLLALPMAWGMLHTAMGRPVQFEPTNVPVRSVLALLLPVFAFGLLLTIIQSTGLNNVWAALIAVSALVLWHGQRRAASTGDRNTDHV